MPFTLNSCDAIYAHEICEIEMQRARDFQPFRNSKMLKDCGVFSNSRHFSHKLCINKLSVKTEYGEKC